MRACVYGGIRLRSLMYGGAPNLHLRNSFIHELITLSGTTHKYTPSFFISNLRADKNYKRMHATARFGTQGMVAGLHTPTVANEKCAPRTAIVCKVFPSPISSPRMALTPDQNRNEQQTCFSRGESESGGCAYRDFTLTERANDQKTDLAGEGTATIPGSLADTLASCPLRWHRAGCGMVGR